MRHETFATMREALIAARLDPEDSRLRKVDKKEGARVADTEKGGRDDAGWVKKFSDGQSGVVCNHRTGQVFLWKENGGKHLTPSEKKRLDKEAAEARAMRDALEAEKWRKAAEIAAEIWQAVQPAVEVGHPYLTRKHVRPEAPLGVIDADAVRSIYQRATGEKVRWLKSKKLDCPISDALLVVPCYLAGDVSKLSAVELIDEVGSKVTLKDARAKDAFWLPADFEARAKESKSIYIAEGIATALSISQVTGAPCVAGRYCHNLVSTAVAVKEMIGRRRIALTVCGDTGYGEADARLAAVRTGAGFKRPVFDAASIEAFKEKTGGDKPTDFNDYFIATGVI